MREGLHNFLILLGILGACNSGTPDGVSSGVRSTNRSSEALQNGSTETTTTTDFTKKPIPPGMAKVSLVDDGKNKPLVLGDTPMTSGIKVPILSFKRNQADYVKILRCPKTYVMRDTLGQSIDELGETPKDLASKEWAWAQAISDARQCKIAGPYVISSQFADLMADTGEFYYVLNPCVTKETSGEDKDGCSYRLAKTDSIAFTDAFRQEYRTKEAELNTAQATLNADINRMYYLSSELSLALKYCEENLAADYQLQSLQAGLLSVGALAAGMALDSLSGGMTLGMGMMMGPQLLQTMVLPKLGIDPQSLGSVSVCSGDPNELQKAIDAEKRPEQKQAMKSQLKAMKKYTSQFKTLEIIKGLRDLAAANPTGTAQDQGYDPKQDCKIDKDQNQLKTVMAELATLDSRSLTWEQAYKKSGIKLDDPQSLVKQLPKVPGGLDMSMLQSLLGGGAATGAGTGK